jgi:hypothetical protein
MFGLEKNKKSALFEFDLEKDLQDDKKYKVLKDRVEKHVQDIKNKIREGANSEEFEKLGLLLHGYSALLKVLTRMKKR